MKKYLLLLAGSICFLLEGINGKAREKGTLTIVVTHIESNEGIVIAHLFKEQDEIPRKPFIQARAEITHGKTIIVFNDIPYGYYAAILFQDKNANEILDHKLGFPNEPMGFSNQWKLSLFSGMPNFRNSNSSLTRSI